jgi:hypothetical protein
MVFLRTGHCFQVPSFASRAGQGRYPRGHGKEITFAATIACTPFRQYPQIWEFGPLPSVDRLYPLA